MRIEHLREFVVFSHHLNFTSAAKELFLAQSTLSTHIAQLEEELGFQLIDRQQGNALTDRGAVFLEGAKMALASINEAIERCARIPDAENCLRVSCQYPPARFVTKLRERLDIPASFVTYDYRQPVFASLAKGQSDVVITYDVTEFPSLMAEAKDLGLEIRVMPFRRMSISMMADNPLAEKIPLKREDLRRAQVVINDAGSYEYVKELMTQMLGSDLQLNFSLEPIGDISNLAYATYGDAIHVCGLAENTIWFRDRDDVVVADTLDGKPFGQPCAVAYRAADKPKLGAAIDILCACMEESAREEGLM